MTVPRVRFAPSPTGFLHVGGARTALFNWLFARRHAGVFVLRIEDTDRTRSDDAMTRAILDGMTWLGLDWDEGPFHQAEGADRHRRDALQLLDAGTAYRCFCTPEDVEARRTQAGGDAFGYDRYCRSVPVEAAAQRAAAGEPHAIRFRVPDGETAWEDPVHGAIRFDNADLEDFVILRSDATPVYNMAVVSDDVEMAITHVIRGDDHVSNTPKQILLYRALGHPLPVFAHLPMILGPDGKRLSKRHGATAVGEYESQGILPAALVNFLALLGWSPANDEEILSVEAMVSRFALGDINRKSAVLDPAKLAWMNGQYMAEMDAESLAPLVAQRIVAHGYVHESDLGPLHERLCAVIELFRNRVKTVDELASVAEPYLLDVVRYQEDAVASHWKDRDIVRTYLRELRTRLGQVEDWVAAALEPPVRAMAEAAGVGAGKVIHPLRVALTGSAHSPGIFDVMEVLGRDRVLERIETALEAIASGPETPDASAGTGPVDS
jgi:glutamyl-tRNA synthetase